MLTSQVFSLLADAVWYSTRADERISVLKLRCVFIGGFVLISAQFCAACCETSIRTLGQLHFRRRHRSEEYPQHLFPAHHAHQLVHRAIHGNKDEQNDLDGPEMRPDDFRQQLLDCPRQSRQFAARNQQGVPHSE